MEGLTPTRLTPQRGLLPPNNEFTTHRSRASREESSTFLKTLDKVWQFVKHYILFGWLFQMVWGKPSDASRHEHLPAAQIPCSPHPVQAIAISPPRQLTHHDFIPLTPGTSQVAAIEHDLRTTFFKGINPDNAVYITAIARTIAKLAQPLQNPTSSHQGFSTPLFYRVTPQNHPTHPIKVELKRERFPDEVADTIETLPIVTRDVVSHSRIIASQEGAIFSGGISYQNARKFLLEEDRVAAPKSMEEHHAAKMLAAESERLRPSTVPDKTPGHFSIQQDERIEVDALVADLKKFCYSAITEETLTLYASLLLRHIETLKGTEGLEKIHVKIENTLHHHTPPRIAFTISLEGVSTTEAGTSDFITRARMGLLDICQHEMYTPNIEVNGLSKRNGAPSLEIAYQITNLLTKVRRDSL